MTAKQGTKDASDRASGLGATSGPGTRSDPVAALEIDIAETREVMTRTLSELQQRIAPDALKAQATEQFREAAEAVKSELQSLKDRVESDLQAEFAHARNAMREATIGRVEHAVHGAKESARQTGRTLADTVRENPVPAVLAGVGLTWLFLGARRGDAHGAWDERSYAGGELHGVDLDDPYAESHGGARGGRTMARAVRASAHERGRRLRHAASEAGDRALHATRRAAGELAHRAQVRGRRVESQLETSYRESPLVVGAAVLAAGTVVGLSLPLTRREEELLAPVGETLVEGARAHAHEVVGKVEVAARRVTEEAARRVGEEAARRVSEVASALTGSGPAGG